MEIPASPAVNNQNKNNETLAAPEYDDGTELLLTDTEVEPDTLSISGLASLKIWNIDRKREKAVTDLKGLGGELQASRNAALTATVYRDKQFQESVDFRPSTRRETKQVLKNERRQRKANLERSRTQYNLKKIYGEPVTKQIVDPSSGETIKVKMNDMATPDHLKRLKTSQQTRKERKGEVKAIKRYKQSVEVQENNQDKIKQEIDGKDRHGKAISKRIEKSSDRINKLNEKTVHIAEKTEEKAENKVRRREDKAEKRAQKRETRRELREAGQLKRQVAARLIKRTTDPERLMRGVYNAADFPSRLAMRVAPRMETSAEYARNTIYAKRQNKIIKRSSK